MTVNVQFYREVGNLPCDLEPRVPIEAVMNPGVQARDGRLLRERSETRFVRREKMAEDIGIGARDSGVV